MGETDVSTEKHTTLELLQIESIQRVSSSWSVNSVIVLKPYSRTVTTPSWSGTSCNMELLVIHLVRQHVRTLHLLELTLISTGEFSTCKHIYRNSI